MRTSILNVLSHLALAGAITYAEVHISRCPSGKLNTGIGRHAPRDRPKSP